MEQIDRHLAELLETPARPVSAILGTGTAEACSSSLALSQPFQLTAMLVVALAIHIEVVAAALEHGDGFGRLRSPTGELLLRQPGDLAQPPEPPPERDILSENNVSSFAFRPVVGIQWRFPRGTRELSKGKDRKSTRLNSSHNR
jgi:hypothetical protein